MIELQPVPDDDPAPDDPGTDLGAGALHPPVLTEDAFWRLCRIPAALQRSACEGANAA